MYGKIYEQTFTGSMRGIGPVKFSTWAYVIAYTQPDHRVELNPSIVSHLIGCDEKLVSDAIAEFCSPDPKSRNKDHEGRKLLQEGEFLYFVVNHDKFRGMRDDDGRKEYMRNYMRERRKRMLTVKSKQCKPELSQAEAISISISKEEEIYCAFPKKVGKPDALKAIKRALLKTSFEDLLARTKAYAAARNGDLDFCPNPATWFNQERFNDDPRTWFPKSNGPKPKVGRDPYEPMSDKLWQLKHGNS